MSMSVSYGYLDCAVQSCGQFAWLIGLKNNRMIAEAYDRGAGYTPITRYFGDTAACKFNGMILANQMDVDIDNTATPLTWGWDQVLDENGELPGSNFKRLREGIERFFITDINNPAADAVAQSTLPVMLDAFADSTSGFTAYWATDTDTTGVTRFNHVPGGSNVLYMDGHVEFTRYGGQFPVGMKAGTTDSSIALTLPSIFAMAAGMG